MPADVPELSDLLLPAGARLVHIGPPKTGTTSIQVAMSEAREEMLAHGAFYPSGPYRRRKAIWSLGLPGRPPGLEVPIRHWEKLVAEVHDAGDLRACVSDENFGRADRAIAERIVHDLGGERVHVVAVARRLDRYLPSKWQERVKWGVTDTFEQWLECVLGDDPTKPEHANAWGGHDFVALVDRWCEFVDPDRFTLVVADESDRALLPRVFGSMLGLPTGLLRPNPRRSNVSLTWSETEVLRRLHEVYERHGWPRADWTALLPQVVAALREADRGPAGPSSAPMPAWAHARVRELSEERVEQARRLPVRVLGDPALLRVPETPSAPEVRAEDLALPVGLAAAAVEGAVRAERERAEQLLRAASREAAVDPGRRPAADLAGRELLGLAVRRAAARLRGSGTRRPT